MKLEAGKRYKMRNGGITAPVQRDDDADKCICFETVEKIDGFFPMWREDGRSSFFSAGGDYLGRSEYYPNVVSNGDSIYDIIEEYTE